MQNSLHGFTIEDGVIFTYPLKVLRNNSLIKSMTVFLHPFSVVSISVG